MQLKINYIDYNGESFYEYRYGAYLKGEDFAAPKSVDFLYGVGQTKEEAAEDLKRQFLEERQIINSIVVLDELSREIPTFRDS